MIDDCWSIRNSAKSSKMEDNVVSSATSAMSAAVDWGLFFAGMTLDEEEVEAMKEISSAADARSLDEVDVYDFPRLVIRGMRDNIESGSRVDALLKVLLPPSKVVFKKQQKDKEKARVAAELREKREIMSKQKKEQEKLQSRRTMYSGV